jgi:hypothetical protein
MCLKGEAAADSGWTMMNDDGDDAIIAAVGPMNRIPSVSPRGETRLGALPCSLRSVRFSLALCFTGPDVQVALEMQMQTGASNGQMAASIPKADRSKSSGSDEAANANTTSPASCQSRGAHQLSRMGPQGYVLAHPDPLYISSCISGKRNRVTPIRTSNTDIFLVALRSLAMHG